MSDLTSRGTLKGVIYRGGSGGVTDYDQLTGRPQINGVTLSGDKNAADLGLAAEEDILITKLNPFDPGGINYPRLERVDTPDGIMKLNYSVYTGGGVPGLVPGKTGGDGSTFLNDHGQWITPEGESDIDTLNWTLLISIPGGALSTYTSVGTAKYLVVIMNYQGVAYTPRIYKVSQIRKILEVTELTEVADGANWKVGSSYDDWEFHFNNNGEAAIKATYSGITAQMYAIG